MPEQHLSPAHEAMLLESAIAPEVIGARGYRTVTTKAELGRLGFPDRQRRVPALLLPIWSVLGEICGYMIRPDEPRIGRNGKPLKYEHCAGSRMVLDVPPGAREQLGDPSTPLWITEGTKKVDAAVSRGLCCIALLGVWNWRGTNEHGGKTAIADWEMVALNDRRVTVVFDSDVMTKIEVYRALVRLRDFLESRGAKVRLTYLPPGDRGQKPQRARGGGLRGVRPACALAHRVAADSGALPDSRLRSRRQRAPAAGKPWRDDRSRRLDCDPVE